MVVERQPDLTRVFYDRLFSQYPAARRLFSRQQAVQEKMLADTLVAAVDHLGDADWLVVNLAALGAKHETYGVEPKMYGWVKSSLMWTLRQVAAADWNDELENQWNTALAAVNEMMLAGYHSNGSTPAAGARQGARPA